MCQIIHMLLDIRKIKFKLIGADYHYLNRDSGETENRSYNFSTKKVKISTHDDSGDKEKTILRSFKY